MKNICFFNTSRTWGGGEKWHFDIAHRLGGDHIAVQVATFPGSELCSGTGSLDTSLDYAA